MAIAGVTQHLLGIPSHLQRVFPLHLVKFVPVYSGGDPLAAYRVEWDSDAMFDYSSAMVSHVMGSEDYYFVVKYLDPLESYFVRVMAYSAQGFSHPQMAIPFFSSSSHFRIELSSNGPVDFSEMFEVQVTTVDGFDR